MSIEAITRESDRWDVESPITTAFDFDYQGGRDQLLRLYDKGTRRQWIGSDRLDWSLEIDPMDPLGMPDEMHTLFGTRSASSATWPPSRGKAVNAYVMQDEARHVMFGRLALRDYYPQLTQVERDEREEFCVDACYRMRDRFLGEEVWERLGLPPEANEYVEHSDLMKQFRGYLFLRIVPILKDIGLWGRASGGPAPFCREFPPHMAI